MVFDNMKYEKIDQVLLVTFTRSASLNALNTRVLKELEELLEKADKMNDIGAVVFTGEGKAFIAGADISEMANLSPQEAYEFAKLGQDVFLKLESFDKPTISAVNGFCLGGGNEFAMSTDMIFSGYRAKFGQPETGLGITPGFAGTSRLLKKVGISKAKMLIYTGEVIQAQEAYDIGLVDKLVNDESLLEEALSYAQKIASNSRTAVRYSKKSINECSMLDTRSGSEVEAGYFSRCFAGTDQREGMNAFMEKRKPNFTDK